MTSIEIPFYYHFQDIPSLLREMMETQADGIIREHCALGRPMDCVEPALEHGLAHRLAAQRARESKAEQQEMPDRAPKE